MYGTVVAELHLVPQRAAGLGVGGRGVFRRDEIVPRHADARERPGLLRDRLRRRIPLARHVRLCLRTFIDAVHRRAGLAVQDEHEAGLADLRERGNRPAVLPDVDQTRRGRQVVVPHLVADVLEVPLQLAGQRVERDGRVAEQVVAGPIAAVVVHARTADRHVDEAALLIDGQRERPDVVAGAILPAVVAPGVVTDFAGPRDGVEVPQLLARARVVGVHVALLALARRQMRADVSLAGAEEIGPHQHDVPVDHRHAGVGNLEIDVAALAERRVQCAGVGAQRDQLSQAREEDARRQLAVAGPVRDAAERGEPFGQLVAPDLLAGLRLERDDAIARGQIHHAVHHDGRDLLEDFERAGRLVDRGDGAARLRAQAVRPRLRERCDVLRVDLRQRRVARAGEVAIVGGPDPTPGCVRPQPAVR